MAADPSEALAPIVVEIVVTCPPDRAFDYFTRDIGRWWPLATHSIGQADATGVRFEPFEGGGIVESVRDGGEQRWGTVISWRPGRQVAFSWHPGHDPASAQSVDVRFAADPAGTRVTLTHAGWDRRADGALARRNYTGGWRVVIGERFANYCASTVGLAGTESAPGA